MIDIAFASFPTEVRELCFSGNTRESQCIGHLRGDFGRDGNGCWTRWFPHDAALHNTASFRQELQMLVTLLRGSLLKDRTAMCQYLSEHPNVIESSGSVEQHGYHAQSEQHDFYIRCNPSMGDYNFYIYCYLRNKEEVSA